MSSESDSREKVILDSMKKVLAFTDSAIYFTDSIKFIYYTKHFETFIFIDYNVNSKIHRYPESDTLLVTDWDKKWYNEQYQEQMKKVNRNSKPLIPLNYKTIYTQVFQYQKSFYLLADYPYQDYYGITDSTFIMRGQMGAEPYIIDSISVTQDSFEMTTFRGVSISLLAIDDNKSVFKLKIGNTCTYVIPHEKIHEFPIMYHLTSVNPTAGVNDYIKLDSIECK